MNHRAPKVNRLRMPAGGATGHPSVTGVHLAASRTDTSARERSKVRSVAPLTNGMTTRGPVAARDIGAGLLHCTAYYDGRVRFPKCAGTGASIDKVIDTSGCKPEVPP